MLTHESWMAVYHSKPCITDEDLRAVDRVIRSGMIAQGSKVLGFEEAIAEYVNAWGGIAVGSGTAAMTLALLGLGVKEGYEVILPTYVCKSVLEAVRTVGAVPVLCDVGEDWNMNAETVASKVGKKTAAIIAIHIFGIPADVPGLLSLGPPVIENCCQAFGSKVNGVFSGTLGVVGVFSFHATKCMTTGEGGMVVSNSGEILAKMRAIREGSFSVPHRIASPMTDIQAALGLSQLERYPRFLRRRREIALRYFSELSKCEIKLPVGVEETSMFFRFPVRVQGDLLSYQRYFEEKGIFVRRGVDALLHEKLSLDPSEFEGAETLFSETLSLPIYPALTEQEVTRVIEVCNFLWS